MVNLGERESSEGAQNIVSLLYKPNDAEDLLLSKYFYIPGSTDDSSQDFSPILLRDRDDIQEQESSDPR